MKIQIALLVGLACSTLAAPIIDPQVFKSLQGKDSTTVIVSFKNSNVAAVRDTFTSLKTTLSTRGARLNVLYNLLKDHADSTQAKVLSFLESQKATKSIRVSQSWMSNELILRGVDKETIIALSNMADVKEIKADRLIPRLYPTNVSSVPKGGITPLAQWGVETVRAPAVHALGNEGEGVVVATIDTGVHGTHEALVNNFRSENGWYDPAEGDKTPTDGDGHGTHTMGTIAGQTNGIGVAPKAKWISCKGCGWLGCYLSDLTDCGNFAGCPTDANGNNPRCDLAPNLVSNSWGGGQGDTFFDDIMAAWRAADIAPIFALGNAGTGGCGSANSPGDSELAIAVGSTTKDETVSYFSSLGPTLRGNRIKPDVAAPGSDVVSASNSGNSAYATMSGTSMATPHVAGISALLYAQRPNLTVNQLIDALAAGAQKNVASTGRDCGNVREDTYPNNSVGHGRADALGSHETL